MFRLRANLPLYGGLALAACLGAALVTVSPRMVMAADPPPAEETKPAPGEKPMSFSDEDLEKFHKPAPAAPGAESPAPARDAQPAKPAPVPAAGKGASGVPPTVPPTLAPAPRPAQGATPSTLAPPAAPLRPGPATAPIPVAASSRPRLPPPDPLKKWKDKDELESFREGQLQSLRMKISGLESRLEYLNLKRLSIQDPTRIMPMPQTDQDRTADQGKGSRDLLASVEKEIEAAESDLTQARENLINIETRFAVESARP